jgi:hypothetical protein
MKNKQRIISLAVILAFGMFLMMVFFVRPNLENRVQAETLAIKLDDDFNQDQALAKLREQIKGKESEPAETVFKNIQILKGRPAAQVLGIMQMGFSRSLGVNCTHCHTPEDWSSESKNKKQIAREIEFQTMIKEKQSEKLNSWLESCKNCGVKELVGFAFGMKPDEAAVTQSMISEWSNGQVKGQVNRLKNSKRQMYGRANFDLLKARVLNQN